MPIRINLSNNLNNDSLQIGDNAYYVEYTTTGNINNTESVPILIGPIIAIASSFLIVDGPLPPDGAFIMFSKNTLINDSSLVGYFAKVKLINNDTDHAEIYRVVSNVALSSK
tara:strand:- start:723 stop:1058 length:336 start_codon:yes stop_codon:yes gene_type:complete